MWWVRHHNKGVGTSPSHPRPKRIFSTDLNRNRVITEKKIRMYYVRHHIKGGLVRHHNENRLGVHKAEANFPIKRKWSLSKKCDVCVSRETRGSVRHHSWPEWLICTKKLVLSVDRLECEGTSPIGRSHARVGRYVTFFEYPITVIRWHWKFELGGTAHANLLRSDVASCVQRTMNALVCQGGCICMFKWR